MWFHLIVIRANCGSTSSIAGNPTENRARYKLQKKIIDPKSVLPRLGGRPNSASHVGGTRGVR